MTKYPSINPTTAAPDDDKGFNANSFAALVKVKSSRYVEHSYNPESGLESKVGIQWIMETTKGNTFERTWPIGYLWKDAASAISADGKKFSKPIKQKSDGWYMLSKAIEGEFPQERLTDDISVFDGEVFFMTEDTNPKVQGSKRKLYPKYYKGNDWEAAKADQLRRRAEKEAQQNAPTYGGGGSNAATLTGSYTPPTVVKVDNSVVAAAQSALVNILKSNGSKIERSQIPSKLNEYRRTSATSWTDAFHKNVAIALFDMEQLKAVVESNPSLKLENETISLQ
jgi:hypothetical protein